MFEIIKKVKFLKTSILMFAMFVGALLLISFFSGMLQERQPEDCRVFWLFDLMLSTPIVCLYWANIRLYSRIADFNLEKESYKLPDVKHVVNTLINVCYALLVLVICCYFCFTKSPILHSLIVLLLIFSIFAGLVSLAVLFSKADHQIPCKREGIISLLALGLFIGSVYLIKNFDIDVTAIRASISAIFVIILMTIMVYKQLDEGKLFKWDTWYYGDWKSFFQFLFY